MTSQSPCCPVCGRPYGVMNRVFRPNMCGACWRSGGEVHVARSAPAAEFGAPGSAPEPAPRISNRGPAIITCLCLLADLPGVQTFRTLHGDGLFEALPLAFTAAVWAFGALIAYLSTPNRTSSNETTAQTQRKLAHHRVWIWSACVATIHVPFFYCHVFLYRFAAGAPPR
jgi:hypothetical protein